MAPPKAFTTLLSPAEARARYAEALRVGPRGREQVAIGAALGRVLAADVTASTDLPPFDRSTVDGWAVRAADTRGATPASPARLEFAFEVQMGSVADRTVPAGGAARIPTGGMLPPGANAVVMQERASVGPGGVLVLHPVREGENVVLRGADVSRGEVVLRQGRRLRPADLGILSGLGLEQVPVFLPPRVAILATGDELAASGEPLRPGRVRDMNNAALAGAVAEAGGLPSDLGIVRDDQAAVEAALRRAIAGHEMVLVSGGSSVGERDVVTAAIAALGPPGIVVHGVAVRPGKPTILAASGRVPVVGLPGNPVSALVIFEIFARPVLDALMGLDPGSGPWTLVRARLTEALPGARVREDHRRVRLESRPDGLWASPLPAGSQILTSLVRAHGIVAVPPGGVGFGEGDDVEVRLIP